MDYRIEFYKLEIHGVKENGSEIGLINQRNGLKIYKRDSILNKLTMVFSG
jgi:hypothetical protein